jgi:hypothetical protein
LGRRSDWCGVLGFDVGGRVSRKGTKAQRVNSMESDDLFFESANWVEVLSFVVGVVFIAATCRAIELALIWVQS